MPSVMVLPVFLIFMFPTIAFALSDVSLKFSVDYFRERNVHSVCLISCGNLLWDVQFTKSASFRQMSLSRLDTRQMSDTNIEQCLRQYYTPIGVLLDTRCGQSERILYFASENMWLDAVRLWLIIDDNKYNITDDTSYKESRNSQAVIDVLKNLNISVDADIILALRNENKFILYDVFNFGKLQGGSLIVNETGFWTSETGLVADLNGYKYYRRWDFGQWTMRMVSVATFSRDQFDPAMLTNIRPVPGISTVTRTSTISLTEIAEAHNIRFVHTVADRWVGPLDRNNTNTQVLSALYFRTQDITSVIRLYPAHFTNTITYIQPPLTSIETRYYYRIPSTGPGKFENQFLRPLTASAWAGVLAVCFLCAIILLGAAKVEDRQGSAQYAVFSVIASFCQQFFEDDYQRIRVISSARKQILFVTGMSCALVYNYYTSSVVSWLLNGPPPSINSLQELQHSPLEVIYEDVGYTRSWLYTPGYYFDQKNKEVEDALRRKALAKKTGVPMMVPLEEGIALVKAGGYAYHTETTSANELISKTFDQAEMCELGSLVSMPKTLLYAVGQKNTPYKEFLTWSFNRISERGVISNVQRRTIRPPAACEGVSPRALALGGAAPAFIMLAIGYLVSVAIMFGERCIHRRSMKAHSFNLVVSLKN